MIVFYTTGQKWVSEFPLLYWACKNTFTHRQYPTSVAAQLPGRFFSPPLFVSAIRTVTLAEKKKKGKMLSFTGSMKGAQYKFPYRDKQKSRSYRNLRGCFCKKYKTFVARWELGGPRGVVFKQNTKRRWSQLCAVWRRNSSHSTHDYLEK